MKPHLVEKNTTPNSLRTSEHFGRLFQNAIQNFFIKKNRSNI